MADHYQVPHVSIRDSIYEEMKAGKYTRDELTPDGLHPNDLGHGLVAGEIIRLLEYIKEHRREILQEKKDEITALPEALTGNAYENAERLTIRNAFPALLGFRADAEEKTGHLDCFKNGWTGRKTGDCLYLEPLLHHGEERIHTVEIEIIEFHKEDQVPFYLLSLIVA